MAEPKKNDEQARQTEVSQGKREKRIADDHSVGVDASAISSAATGNDEIRTGGAIRQRGDSGEPFRTSRRTISGGILRQLIEENGIQLAHYKSEVERLERRQRQLEELFEELRVKTGEDLDDEDEVEDEEGE
ncbi:hypothetical protein H6F96_18480 [Microcoleus sp. FACHB-53]|nr:hypothetical protein [Microcoleus sp. FACHB-53]